MRSLHFAFRCRSPRKGFLPHACGVFPTGAPAKSSDFVGRGAAAERVSFRPLAEANDTQLADSTSALYAMEKDRQDCRHAKYVNSYNCCKKVLDRMEEQNQAERMFIKITVKEAKQCFCNIKNLPANSFRRKEKK